MIVCAYIYWDEKAYTKYFTKHLRHMVLQYIVIIIFLLTQVI